MLSVYVFSLADIFTHHIKRGLHCVLARRVSNDTVCFYDPGEVTMDEMFCDFMRKDIGFRSDKDALDYYKRAQSVLRDELLTCYQYFKDNGRLQDYHDYRGN
uniref:hypothetical protein n=1 Tax=Eubacterium cellulosolvens TaxID=29322 RepID=UPI0012DC989E|nr:hypothetical protein [[Eubacterium] cellulosolvens]